MGSKDRRSRLKDIHPVEFETKSTLKKKWILFGVAAVLVIALTVGGIFLYRHFFPGILPANTTYNAHVLHTNTLNSSEKEAVYAPYKDGVVVATRNQICFYNTKGETKWQLSIAVLNPLLKVNGNYILVADKNAQDVYLIKDGKIVTQSASTYNILNAGVAGNGTFYIVEDEPHYKGKLTVRNTKNQDLFVWHSGAAYIIDAAFNDRASQIALTTLTVATPSADVQTSYSSTLMLFKLHESAPYVTQTYDGQIAANIFLADGQYIVITDKSVEAYSATSGAHTWSYAPASQTLQHVEFYNKKLALITASEDGTQSLHILKSNGTTYCQPVSGLVNMGYLSLSDNIVATGNTNNAIVYKLDGTLQYHIALPKSYSDICLFNNGQYILGTNNIVVDVLVTK